MIDRSIEKQLTQIATKLIVHGGHHAVQKIAQLAGVKATVAMIFFAASQHWELYHHAACGDDICVKKL